VQGDSEEKHSLPFEEAPTRQKNRRALAQKPGRAYVFTRMRIEKTAQTVFTPLADGTGVLLNLDTLVYYRLNRTAAALWQEIESRAAYTLDDLVHHACEKYEVDDLPAHQSLREFVARLAEFKMIRIA
jgi:hypothetical protein